MSQQGNEGKGKDIWSRLGRSIRTGAGTIVQETKELTKVGKLKVELMGLENERGRKLEEIGSAAHTLHKTGAMLPPELFELLQAADEIENRISQKNKEIESVRVESPPPNVARQQEAPAMPSAEIPPATPPPVLSEQAEPAEVVTSEQFFCGECGARVESGNVFCGKCGAKLQ